LVMKRGDQFFYRFPIIEAFQDRQTKGLTQLVMTWQLRYGKRHEGPPSDNSCDFFFQYVRLKTPSVCLLTLLANGIASRRSTRINCFSASLHLLLGSMFIQ